MKKIFLFSFLSFLYSAGFAQKSNVCCSMDPAQQFTLFASNKEFSGAHQEPLPFVLQNQIGKMITFKTADGKDGNAYFIPSKTKTKNYLLVFQEWWGLNDYIKKESERLYSELGNVNVIAVDMYDGKVTSSREEAANLMSSVKGERMKSLIIGAINYAGKDAKIATIGWCFGGGLSFKAALLGGNKVKACVIYYGMPETDPEKLKPLKADVLGIFANKEKWISPEVVTKFENSMKQAKKNVIIKRFDAEHAFANPSNPQFDKAATEEAAKLATEFLKTRLK